MNINPRTTHPRNHRSQQARLRKLTPGTCHMLRDGRILTTAEARRLLLKRYWSDPSDQKSSG